MSSTTKLPILPNDPSPLTPPTTPKVKVAGTVKGRMTVVKKEV